MGATPVARTRSLYDVIIHGCDAMKASFDRNLTKLRQANPGVKKVDCTLNEPCKYAIKPKGCTKATCGFDHEYPRLCTAQGACKFFVVHACLYGATCKGTHVSFKKLRRNRVATTATPVARTRDRLTVHQSSVKSVHERRVQTVKQVEVKTTRPVTMHCYIDASGSMAGSRMSTTKDGVHTFFSHLTDRDCIGVTTFNSAVHTVTPIGFKAVAEKKGISQTVSQIKASGQTSLYDAIIHGCDAMKASFDRNLKKMRQANPGVKKVDLQARNRLDKMKSPGMPLPKIYFIA